MLAVNQRFLSYGPPRFQNYLDASKFGPGLSAADEEGRTRRFGAGFANSTVGRAMVCAACHKPERLGAFNWPMDSVVISSYIKGGQMPIGLKLKTSERNELYRKLIEEYFAIDHANPGILQGWLMGSERQVVRLNGKQSAVSQQRSANRTECLLPAAGCLLFADC